MRARTNGSPLRRVVALLAVSGMSSLGLVATAPPSGSAPAGGSYTVTSTGDQADLRPGDGVCLSSSGLCTLRAALQEANLDRGPSSISFLIPGIGTQTITIGSTLPELTDTAGGTTIDGYTQPGSSVNTDPLVDNAVLRVQIRSAMSGSTAPDGLDIASSNNVIRGLSFFSLRLAMNMVFGGNGNVIVGDFIGTNAAGTFFDPATNSNTFGVVMDQLASNNVIGRPGAADRNVISGNSGRAVMLKDAVVDNTIQNNIVGLSPDGRSRLPNADHGIDVNAGAVRTLIGGTGFQEGNLISGNDGHGIEISHPPCCGQPGATADNRIIGNRIGTDPTGKTGPSYAQNGVRYSHENVHLEDHVTRSVIAYNIIGNSALGGIKVDSGSSFSQIHDNRIGIAANGAAIPNGPYGIQIEAGANGTVVGPNNIITNNRSGIRLQGDTTVNNTITGNSVFGNDRLGIDIAPFDVVNTASVATATNGGARFPILVSAGGTWVSGETCPYCQVELYESDSRTTDASLESSYGEGKTFLAARQADPSGHFLIQFPGVAADRLVTSTATDPAGNTSEFSRNIVVPDSTAPK